MAYDLVMDPTTFKCPRCDHTDTLKQLVRHCDLAHDMYPHGLYRALFLDDKDLTCACGCGQVITYFWDMAKGFSKFMRDHHSRVKNNWKGGASALQPIVRAWLHAAWTYPRPRASGFTCSSRGVPGPGLEVHHDGERFAVILLQAIAVHGEVDPRVP